MARSGEPALDLEEDGSGDFVLPSRVARKKMSTKADGGKRKTSEVDPGAAVVKLVTFFSVNKIRTVIGSFSGQKKLLLDSIGFGGLLLIPSQSRISRQLAFWLLRNLDNDTSSIVLRDGARIPFSNTDVNFVLGLPHKDDTVARQKVPISRAAEIVKCHLGLAKHADIRIDYIESLLMKDYHGKMSMKEKIAFKVAIVLFVDAYFLAPKSSPARVNYGLLPYLVDPDSIHLVNWSAYLLKVVKDASIKVKHCESRGKKNVSLDCCLLFLEVFYLDNLDTGTNIEDHPKLPRVSDFPHERIKHMVSEDMEASKDGGNICFGKLKVKASDQVVYCWGTSNISAPGQSVASTQEDPEQFVMSRFKEFKEQLDQYKSAYVDQIESLFINLEYSISHFLCARSTDNKNAAQSCSELTVSCVEGQDSMMKKSPSCYSEPLLSPSLGIRQKIEAIDLCSPGSNMLKPSALSISPEIRSYGVYSAGPAFDQSAVRGSGERSESLDGTKLMQSSELEFGEENLVSGREGSHLSPFPESPFRLMLEDQAIPRSVVLALQAELGNMCEEDLERYWFVHMHPTNISLSGRRLREEFTCITEWTVAVVDAISRLLMHLDDTMYDGETGNRWRHFLPASWSEVILHGSEFRWLEESEKMFRSTHINYNVEHCRMICAPVLVEASWSCYIWDFQECVLTVIDPRRMVHDKDYVRFKHQLTVEKLNSGLATCLGSRAWATNYLSVDGANCESWYSGLYSMFYARAFDGRCLTQLIPRDLIPYTRCKYLYQLLSMAGNVGQLPSNMSLARL